MHPAPETPEARLDRLWQDHAPAVLRYARRRVLPADVDEVVAETFLVAWRRLPEVPDVALPWLLGVARRVSANVLRSTRRRAALHGRLASLPDVREPTAAPDPPAVPGLQAALQALGSTDRELLTLLAWDGLTRQEAALALGVSRGAVAVRLHRLRRRLRDALPAQDEPELDLSSPASPSHPIGQPT